MQVLAQVNIGEQFQPATKFNTIGGLVSVILPNLYIFAGILLFVLLVVGGFGLIASAGGSNPQQAEKGKNAITAALFGFLIIFLSYWIIKIIETITGMTIFSSGL